MKPRKNSKAKAAEHPLASTLAAMMDEHDISAQRMFNRLDVDGNGTISMAELQARSVKNMEMSSILMTWTPSWRPLTMMMTV